MADQKGELTKGKLKGIASKLRQASKAQKPEGQKVSKMEGVRTLITEITDLRKRGYTLAEVADLLSNEGMPISTTVLRSYVHAVAHEGGLPPARATTRKRRDTPARPPAQPAAGKGTFHPRPDTDDI